LMPSDPFNVPIGQSSREVESLRVKLTETKNTTANLVNVIKSKNILLSKDLTKIEVLNNRFFYFRHYKLYVEKYSNI